MKTVYLDIMERALSAYAPQRIRSYIDEVRRDGLTEHGFPRLGANIGILLAHGRCPERMADFLEIMDICCEQIPKVKAANDFSVREICCCLALLEKTNLVDPDRLSLWKSQLRRFDPWTGYDVIAPSPSTPIANWAAFGAVSEFVRGRFLGIDTTEFVDWQVSSQLLNFDENGMYKDPHNPMVYELVGRNLLASLLHFGYNGKHRAAIEENLDRSVLLTLQLQSVTGEIPFGGRSNQFYHNEPWLAACCEMEAVRHMRKGDPVLAAQLKAAAQLAANYTWHQLNKADLHHIKNKYPVDLLIGCENYGYFNKYMITAASFAYLAYIFADDTIQPTQAPAAVGGFTAQTSADFHKTVLNAGGYFLEFELDADPNYDANGLGRVHKAGCPSALCLSVPFSAAPKYRLPESNPAPMSLCSYAGNACGAENAYTLVSRSAESQAARAAFLWESAAGAAVQETYLVTESGITVTLSGGEDVGFMLPAFDYDGQNSTQILEQPHCLTVSYEGSVCTYRFDGILQGCQTYHNRNGRYRVYRVSGRQLHIELKESDHV